MSDLQPVDEYVKRIREANPQLSGRADDTIRGLANLYRLLDHQESLLEENPSNATSINDYIKLRTLAIRHEITLGIVTKREVLDDPEPFPSSGRRPQRREYGA